jgi:1-acyl-sn-glycerol-3-phosphate acyltransferase
VGLPIGYRFLRGCARLWLPRLAEIRVEGMENIPEVGPCLLIPNHQSALDPLLVQGVCRRAVYTMTKSTQFHSPVFRILLRMGLAFPVRRYRVDPQAVRVLLRRLEAGDAVCLYPEGERSWDGTLQPFRRGAVRVILRAGVPVIPVGIDGTYDVLPRWASRPRRAAQMTVRFGAPLDLGSHPSRFEREKALPGAEAILREALLELSGEVVAPPVEIPEAGGV